MDTRQRLSKLSSFTWQLPKMRFLIILVCLLACGLATAQWERSGRRGRGDRDFRRGVPIWENDPVVPKDTFTFVRLRYDSHGGYGRRGGGW